MFSIIIKNVWSYFFSLIGSWVLERYRKKIFIGLQGSLIPSTQKCSLIQCNTHKKLTGVSGLFFRVIITPLETTNPPALQCKNILKIIFLIYSSTQPGENMAEKIKKCNILQFLSLHH